MDQASGFHTHCSLHRLETKASAFAERICFILGQPSKETGGKFQICLPHQGLEATLKNKGLYVIIISNSGGLIGQPWNLAVMVNGFSTASSWTMESWLLKGFWCSSSGHVLILWFCEGGETLVPGAAGGQVLFLYMLWLKD